MSQIKCLPKLQSTVFPYWDEEEGLWQNKGLCAKNTVALQIIQLIWQSQTTEASFLQKMRTVDFLSPSLTLEECLLMAGMNRRTNYTKQNQFQLSYGHRKVDLRLKLWAHHLINCKMFHNKIHSLFNKAISFHSHMCYVVTMY